MIDESQYLPSRPFSVVFTSLQDSAGTSDTEPMRAARDMIIRKYEVRLSYRAIEKRGLEEYYEIWLNFGNLNSRAAPTSRHFRTFL